MARQVVEIKANKEIIRVSKEPINVVVSEMEYIEGEKGDYIKVTFQQDENGVVKVFDKNFLNPFQGEEKYLGPNIAKYLMLFHALSDTPDIKAAEEALGGFENEFPAFFDSMKGYLAPNWQTIPCQIMLCYPISKEGVVAKFADFPKVGRYITSAKNNQDLAEWTPEYMSLEKGGDAPEERSNLPATDKKDKRNF